MSYMGYLRRDRDLQVWGMRVKDLGRFFKSHKKVVDHITTEFIAIFHIVLKLNWVRMDREEFFI